MGVVSWVLLSRIPFHAVGIMPFVLGSVLGWKMIGAFRADVFFWGLAAVILVMLSTYLNGEVYDRKEDALSASLEKNAFSGGSQVLVGKPGLAGKVKFVSLVCCLAALAIGILLQFYFRTGAWTLPLGLTGIVFGFYYSKPPFRWVTRGIGELLIAYSYGWLPVAVGCYLQSGAIPQALFWISFPVALSVFNVILINEFPDYPADVLAGKRNLLVRIGKDRGVLVYSAAAFFSWAAVFFSVWQAIPALLSSAISLAMLTGQYRNRRILEAMCAATIVVNLLISVIFIITLL